MERTIRCPNCGTLNLPDAQFCDQCSRPLTLSSVSSIPAMPLPPGVSGHGLTEPPASSESIRANSGASDPASGGSGPSTAAGASGAPASGSGPASSAGAANTSAPARPVDVPAPRAANPPPRTGSRTTLLVGGALIALGLFLGVGLMAVLLAP